MIMIITLIVIIDVKNSASDVNGTTALSEGVVASMCPLEQQHRPAHFNSATLQSTTMAEYTHVPRAKAQTI